MAEMAGYVGDSEIAICIANGSNPCGTI